MTDNPYQSPASDTLPSAGDLPLASRGRRFVGALLDGMVTLLAMAPAMAVMLVSSYIFQGTLDPDGLDAYPAAQVMVALTFVGCLALASGGQWYLISTRGQSIGKIAMKTRIVRLDGSPVGFINGVLLRSWVLSGIQGTMGILCMGWAVPLLDGAFIFFSPHRRCLHDHIASTVVIDADFDPRDALSSVF